MSGIERRKLEGVCMLRLGQSYKEGKGGSIPGRCIGVYWEKRILSAVLPRWVTCLIYFLNHTSSSSHRIVGESLSLSMLIV